MPTTFHFELVSPDKVLFNGSAQAVLVPGAEGDFQVLSDHAPVMTAMRAGVVGIDDAEGKQHRVLGGGGRSGAEAGKTHAVVGGRGGFFRRRRKSRFFPASPKPPSRLRISAPTS